MSEEGNSVRKLPPGKLQNLKQLFEEKDAQATGPPIFGVTSSNSKTPAGRGRPLSNNIPAKSVPEPSSSHPKPAPRHGSPGRISHMAPDFPVNPAKLPAAETSANQGTLPRPRQRRTSEKQEWSTATLDRKPKQLSPTVSKRVALFTDGEQNGNKEEVEHRLKTPAAKSGSPKRLSDPSAVVDQGVAAWQKTSTNRRRTVDNVSLAPENTSDVRVLQQLRKFEQKPELPKKPVVPVIGQNMTSITNAQRRHPTPARGSGDDAVCYEDPWDVKPTRNVDRLKKIVDRSSAPVNITPGQSPGRLKPGPVPGSAALSPPKNQGSKLISRPLEHPPPPPPPAKPPRTYAHDEYLQAKAQAQKSQSAHKETVLDDEGYNTTGTVKNRVSVPTEGSGNKQEVTMRTAERYSHLGQVQKEKGIRETPPARPPPPRPRPISEGTALLNRRDPSPESDSEGPVVISLKKGRPIGRQISVSGPHRNPRDRLPATPEKCDSLQRFPLRKSFSSECLCSGSMSSLSDVGGDEDASQASMMRSCHAHSGGEPVYEALIDNEGYAVPHKFLRIPTGQESEQPRDSQASSKPGFLKRVLGPTVSSATAPAIPSSTPIKEQDLEKVPRRKMNLVRQKVNQAYEVLHTVFHHPSTAEEGEQNPSEQLSAAEDRDSADSDSIVDVQEIKRRVNYCSTVRMRTYQSVKKAREFVDKTYPQLFEYAVFVGLCAKTDDPGYKPHVIHKFPPNVDSNVSVPKFCFPDADEFRPGFMAVTSESYSFVLTDIDGGRLFGYCRRIQPHDASLPEVICIISPVDAFNMYNKLLSEIETRRSKSLDLAQEMIASAFGRPMPNPGKVCHFRALNEDAEMETVYLERPLDRHLGNVNYESLLLYLGTDKLIKVFSSMLMERRLILCSKHLSTLTQTIHALGALLYPFHWQHVYIPLLPPDMLEVCAAPMPFIVGILRSHLARVTSLELEDVIIVDLDKKNVIRSMGDELTLLPKKVQKALRTALNMCRIDSDAHNSQWLMISEAFMRMFLETMGHFTQHILTQQDGSKTLLKEQFIVGAASKGIRQFLEWFTETQMFEVFINMQLERQHWGSMDLFMQRLGELQCKAEGSQSKGLGQKVKNLGKVIKTKLKEAT